MLCFSKICRICKNSTNSSTCNNLKEVSNLFFSTFPELMNCKLNHFLKNLCELCVTQLLSFENFKNQCLESDQFYMRYLNQLESHDGAYAELVCQLGIKQEECQNVNSPIQPIFNKSDIQDVSSYYGSTTQSSSTDEDNIKHEDCIIGIKKENEGALCEEAIPVLGWETSNSEEIKYTLTLPNQETFTSDYHSSINEENVDVKVNENEIDCTKDTINLGTIELSSNSEIEDFNLKIINSNVDANTESNSIKLEYYQGKDDLSSIPEDDVTEIDIVKQEFCIADEDALSNSIDSSIINNEIQEITETKSSLNQHLRKDTCMVEHTTHTDEKPFDCDTCKKSFSYQQSLIIHSRVPNYKEPYECDVCKKRFSQKYIFNNHKRIHTGEKPYECDVCKKCFSIKHALIRHKRNHLGERPYECNICKKSYTAKSHLIDHQRIHNDEKPFECDICKTCFFYKKNLIQHKRIHTGEKPYECDICKKSFSAKSQLIKHKRTHTGERPYECDVCNKCFTQSHRLFVHKRCHTGEKPYECDVCKKCFSEKCQLNSHTRTHTGEKPYECDICKKCFSTKSYLIFHKRNHTGEKPYECEICKKCFSSKSYLILHKKNHTGEKPYECDVCKKRFTRKLYLASHKKTHADKNSDECVV